MLRYIVRRLLMMIPVLIGATLIVFAIMDSSPGDPALSKVGVEASPEQVEELRESMGLNDPFFIRYGRFLLGLLHGDLGTSYKNDLSVMEQVMSRLPNRTPSSCHLRPCCLQWRWAYRWGSYPPDDNIPSSIISPCC